MKRLKEFPEYGITVDGRVFSYKQGIWKKELIDSKGRKAYQFKVDGKKYRRYTHRLLAEAYIPNPDNKWTVNHIDGDRLNNSLGNLEWMTAKENHNHAISNGLHKGKRGRPKMMKKAKVEEAIPELHLLKNKVVFNDYRDILMNISDRLLCKGYNFTNIRKELGLSESNYRKLRKEWD